MSTILGRKPPARIFHAVSAAAMQEGALLRKRAGGRMSPLEFGHFIWCDDSHGNAVVQPAIFGVNMLIYTVSDGTWTYDQYKTWLTDAGFSTSPWREIGGGQIIKAIKQ